MSKRSYDWETIEKEYRSGQLSIREIGRQYGPAAQTIVDRAKRRGWTRDLSDAVRRDIRSKLIRHDSGADGNADTDNASIVSGASERGFKIIMEQRADIANLRRLEQSLIKEIEENPTKLYITQYQGQIIEKVVGLTAAERAMAANNLANVQHKRIALERQAYNLDTSPDHVIADLIGRMTPESKQMIAEALKSYET